MPRRLRLAAIEKACNFFGRCSKSLPRGQRDDSAPKPLKVRSIGSNGTNYRDHALATLDLAMLLTGLSKLSARRAYRWNIDLFNGRAIRGWVSCLRDPSSPSLVVALHQGKAVSPIVTTEARPDLVSLGYGAAAFALELTSPVADGIDIAVLNPAAGGSWVKIERSMPRHIGLGMIDSVEGNKVRGWAACFDDERGDFVILARCHDQIVAKARPFLARPDAADMVMLRDDRLGFELILPWRATEFETCAVSGDINGRGFRIGDIMPGRGGEPRFSQAFVYSPESRFWT